MRSSRSTETLPESESPATDMERVHQEVVRTVASPILLDLKRQKSASEEDRVPPTKMSRTGFVQ